MKLKAGDQFGGDQTEQSNSITPIFHSLISNMKQKCILFYFDPFSFKDWEVVDHPLSSKSNQRNQHPRYNESYR